MEALLLLADGRFPGGGYAHSGGLEAAVADGAVGDLRSLAAFVTGRLATVGLVEAWFAAAACRAARLDDAARLHALDAECEACMPSPALRAAGLALGRGLKRAAGASWPAVRSSPARQHPVVLGAVAAAAGLDAAAAARLALHGAAMTVVNAAPKLIALDMADAVAVVAGMTELIDELALEATAGLDGQVPVAAALRLEERAERHRHQEVRLFAT
jgi:urease accessory protein